MLVKFNPTLGTGNNSTTLYAYNFMRCIDAIITAGAGTTPVVRPLTAAATFDGATNMITQVISNTEAGGWTRSSSYNLVDASYAGTGITNRTYVADYYNNSGKADYPYKKFTITPGSYSTWTSYPYMMFRYGIHTATDYTGTAGYSNSTTSFDMSQYGFSTYNASNNYATGLPWRMDRANTSNIGTALLQGMEFTLAVTADYIILIEPLAFMMYCGTRTTQQWEDTYSNNPPLVAFVTSVDNRYITGAAYVLSNTKAAWMLTRDGTGAIRSSPSKIYQYWTENAGRSNDTTDYVSGNFTIDIANGASNVGINGCRLVGDESGGPLFNGGYQYAVQYGTPGIISPPTIDSSGALVPPAYPINAMVMESSTVTSYTYLNRGGRCLGIYKGMSGSDAYMNNYYTVGQIFTIDGDSYTPILTNGETANRDMFLIRAK
jgi:hypothetical protein